MRFRNIKKFTGQPNYMVHIPLDSVEEWCNKRTCGPVPDLDPDFQRGYVWTQNQKEKYIEYILRGGIHANIILFNHPGWMGDFQGDFVLVDGKQRLDSVIGFMNNKVKAFGYYFNEFEDQMPTMQYCLQIGVNNLQTRLEVLEWYLELNTGGTVHTEKDINKVIELIKIEKEKMK